MLYTPDVLALFQQVTMGTGNRKVGTAWSIPNISTCPGRTALCESLCYAGIGHMAIHQREGGAYDKRWKAIVKLMAMLDGEHLAALALIAACQGHDTVRIHDSGDFFSPAYVRVWIEVVRALPATKFWFYTRSWRVPTLCVPLRLLAAQPNVAGWVSADDECWIGALVETRDYTAWAGMAYMQTDASSDFPHIVQKTLGKRRFLNFPGHGAFGRELVNHDAKLRNCPAITGDVPMPKKPTPATPAACLACKICLPK